MLSLMCDPYCPLEGHLSRFSDRLSVPALQSSHQQRVFHDCGIPLLVLYFMHISFSYYFVYCNIFVISCVTLLYLIILQYLYYSTLCFIYLSCFLLVLSRTVIICFVLLVLMFQLQVHDTLGGLDYCSPPASSHKLIHQLIQT